MTTVRLGRLGDFADGELVPVEVAGVSYLVARDGDGVCVVRNKCPHLGLPLSKGPGGIHYDDGVVQCPGTTRASPCAAARTSTGSPGSPASRAPAGRARSWGWAASPCR